MAVATFFREIAVSDDVLLKIEQRTIGDVNAVVWDSALACCAYLRRVAEKESFAGKRAIELGAGTGACGLVNTHT